MAASVQYLVDQVRLVSGLRNNRLFSSEQIVALLNDGYRDFRDKVIVAGFAGWFRDTYLFTLSASNELDLSLVPRLEMVQGLDLLTDPDNPTTIEMLPSFAQRNNYNAAWPFTNGWSFNGSFGRNYMIDGDSLFILPAANASGNYRLIYTPQAIPLALPTTPPARTVSLDTGDVIASIGRWTFPAAALLSTSDLGSTFTVSGATNPGNNGAKVSTAFHPTAEMYTAASGLVNETFTAGDTASIQQLATATRTFAVEPGDFVSLGANQMTFANAGFTDSDVGATMTLALESPYEGFDGEYEIVAVASSTTVFVNTIATTPGVNPLGGSVVIDRHAVGTVAELPQPLTPWDKYLILHASIAIRTSRQQQTNDLELQFQQIAQRVTALTKQRSEGVRQAPRRMGYGRGGY